MSKKSLVIGHRGACGYAPENTLSSFKKAVDLSVDMVELDVHQCASGQLIVIHDDTVDRTTDGTGYVSQKTYEELSMLTVQSGEKIPTLNQVLDFIDKKVVVNIEIKDPHVVHLLGALITRYVEEKEWTYDCFLVSSFDIGLILQMKSGFPHIPRAPIFECYSEDDAASIKESECSSIIIDYKCLTKKLLDFFHREKLHVFVYTVNNHHRAQKLKEWGVDGIISDFPDRIV